MLRGWLHSLTLKCVDQMNGDVCRARLVCREITKSKKKDEQLGADDVFSRMPPSEGLTMLVFPDDYRETTT